MTRKILCTTDFSQASQTTMRWAIDFSREQDAELTILYAYRLKKNMGEELVSWKKKIEEEASRKFVVFEDECLKGKGIKYQFKTEVGFVADRIEEHAKKNQLNFLVIDKAMYKDNIDTLEDLLDHVNVPLIIMPNN